MKKNEEKNVLFCLKRLLLIISIGLDRLIDNPCQICSVLQYITRGIYRPLHRVCIYRCPLSEAARGLDCTARPPINNKHKAKFLVIAKYAGHVRQTSADVQQRAQTMPDILSSRVQYT